MSLIIQSIIYVQILAKHMNKVYIEELKIIKIV